MVIVDTSVWLQFLKAGVPSVRAEMDALRARGEVAVVGVVMAELLQGSRSQQELEQFTEWLTALPYLAESQHTWAMVGNLSYQLHRNGTPIPMLDLLIGTLALEYDCAVYTLDEHFRRIPGLEIYNPEAT